MDEIHEVNDKQMTTSAKNVAVLLCSPQPGQREGQGQAQPEGLRGRSEVEDEAVARPVVRARGHDPEEEHHREETAQTDREVEQRGG